MKGGKKSEELPARKKKAVHSDIKKETETQINKIVC
jgi:hypothetical protein